MNYKIENAEERVRNTLQRMHMASSNIIDEDLKTVCLLVALTFPLSDWLKKKMKNATEIKCKEEGLERYVTKDAPMGIICHH